MKRKLLNGLLLVAGLFCAGTFQSCKDYESDLQNQMAQENYTLQQQIDMLKNRLGDLEKVQAECKTECNRRIQEILDMIGVWDPAVRGTLAQNIQDLLDRMTALENKPGEPGQPGLTAEEIQDIVTETLEQYGWPTEPSGAPMRIDLEGIQNELIRLAQEVAAMQANISALETYIEYLRNLDLENRINDIEAWIANHKDCPGCSCPEALTREEIEQMIQTQLDIYKIEVNQVLSSLRTYIDDKDAALGGRIDALQQTIDGIQETINNLGSRLTAAENNALAALTLAQTNEAAITLLQGTVGTLQGALDAMENRIDDLEDRVGINETAIANLRTDLTALENRVTALETQYEDLNNRFQTLSDDLDALNSQVTTNTSNIEAILERLENFLTQEDLDSLVNRVKACEDQILTLQGEVNTLFGIYDRLNKLITGIIVQAVYNPLFGTFSMPMGIQSNMLLNYYGRYTGVKDLKFPSLTPSTEMPMLTQTEVDNLGSILNNAETIKSGEFLMDGNMGKVYLTINPNNVNLSGVNLTLETSNGTPGRVELRNVQSSWENLTFGYSRANGNGFYEADAVLPLTAGNINNTEFKLADGLKDAVKDILKDRTKANVFNLMKTVFQTINQDLPAYAVKSSWTANDGQGEKEYAVYSNYNIAAVTFRPLSYNTYRGQSIGVHFKHHGPLSDVKELLNKLIKTDRFHFSLKANVSINPVNVRFHLDRIDDITLNFNGTINAHSDGLEFDIYDDNGTYLGKGHTGPVTIPVNGADLTEFLDQLAGQVKDIINDQLPIWDQQMHDEFNRAMNDLIGQVNGEVNSTLKDLEANVNSQIDKIINDFKNDIANKTQGLVNNLNKFLDKYNQAIDKINDFMADPNHYLQVALLYNTGSGNLHRLSNAQDDPTILNPDGGNSIELIATSYSAEIAAPAYRKFVAISEAWDNTGKALSASQIQALNQGGNIGQVLTGRAKRIALPTDKMKSGYTYQIVYVGLDYHGYTSTERFYVRMK